ncbi:hypothetical protein ABZ259_35545, partial [Streptomyces cyaneofuscatus]
MHSIELLPDEATERVVRRVWRAIADEGLPSQADGHARRDDGPGLRGGDGGPEVLRALPGRRQR